MALFWRVWVAVVLVNLVVLSLFVGLAALQFDSINSRLVGERLTVLAGRTAAPFKAAAKIGLPLSGVRNAQALLERARQTDDDITAIHVFDTNGRIVHSTSEPSGEMIPADAMPLRAQAVGATWNLETGVGFLSSIDIPAADGTSAGGILIVYPAGGNITQVRAMAANLAMGGIAVLAFASVVAGAVLWVGLRQPIRTFDAIELTISDFERRAWRGAAGALDDQNPRKASQADDLRHLLDAAEARYQEIGAGLGEGR